MTKVAHLSSLHPRHDIRIFIKMCVTLAGNGYEVVYVVADGQGDESRDGVSIIDTGFREPGRLARMRKTARQVLHKALSLDADIYHLHDPELIPVGLKLKRLGKIVIFDAHEDLPEQIRNKPYLGRVARTVLAWIFARYQRLTLNRFDALVGATPLITNKLSEINPVVASVNNYPILQEIQFIDDWSNRQREVIYLGGISKNRGIKENILAMELTSGVILNLAGTFGESSIETLVKSYPAWQRVNALGFVDRAQVSALLNKSMAGLVTLHPISNYIDALPIKMFEYMAAGIPVIASNFPLWRGIIEDCECGICVDPLDVSAIARAIQYVIDNPGHAAEMGRNGRRAVEEKYNWANEADKLLELYGRLVS